MGEQYWVRRDGKRELRHTSTHCMGDSEYALQLVERPTGRVLYSNESDDMSALPGLTGRVFYVRDCAGLEVRSTETGEVVSHPAPTFTTYAPDPQDVRLLAAKSSGKWPPPPGELRVIEVATGRDLFLVLGDLAAFSPDGRLIAALDHERRARVYDSATGALKWQSAPLHEKATYAFFSKDGTQVLVSDSFTETGDDPQYLRKAFRFFDAQTGAEVAEPAPPLPPSLRGITQAHHGWW